MTKLEFNDGVSIDTSGAYRAIHLDDGWYVAGQGCLFPCDDKEDAESLRDRLTAKRVTG